MKPFPYSCSFSRSLAALAAISGVLVTPHAKAISPDNAPAEDNSIAAEKASFQVHEDFEVSLFADESLGIANPIAIQWDPRGRLWVLCTLAYAQLKPGELPDDKLFILEDTDGDGKADRSTVFANGLDMPTGFALGHGGAWIAEGPDLVHLRDTDGDDRADEREVVLTGFGTGDTHQNISNLKFDAGGFLYFTQGLHAFSQVETPWGVARGDTAGFWRFLPRVTRLEPFGFPSMTSQNPCGVALDRWGALFIKSNGPHLCFATPALIPTTHSRELMVSGQVGQTPGKSMGGAVVESAHLPDWIQHHAIIAGYFAREVSALPLVEEGSGFAVSKPIRLIYSEHPSFRPVDVLPGPDGAIYVSDWFNPIINHYQVSLRHPDRDYSHGRIWRLAAKDAPPGETPALTTLDHEELFALLRSGERWTREQARRLLADDEDPSAVTGKLRAWIATNLDPEVPAHQVALVEAAGVFESHGAVSPTLLDRLQASPNPRVRAAAARIIGRAVEPVPDADERLASLIADPHPRPRLEAVVACANRPGAESMKLALGALDAGDEPDRYLDYALGQTVFAREADWKPALEEDVAFLGDPAHLAFVLETVGGADAATFAREALENALETGERSRLLAVLARFGNATDLRGAFTEGVENRDGNLLAAVVEASEQRRLRPEAPYLSALESLVQSPDEELGLLGLRLAGLWKAREIADLLPGDAAAVSPRREKAILRARAEILGKAVAPDLRRQLESSDRPERRIAAMEALLVADATEAARAAVNFLATDGENALPLTRPLLADTRGTAALAVALKDESAPAIDDVVAQALLNLLNQSGRSHPELTPILNQIAGIESAAPDYDPERVRKIVAAVRAGEGDPKKGRDVYLAAQLSCVACHRVGDEGGVIGPALTNVGAGMPLDQIVESVLWPERQIKEGFQAVSLTTKEGRAITGYLEREDEDLLWYRNTTTPWILPLDKSAIAERRNLPTLMPAGLTHSLDEQQFLDLIAYLASLKG